MSKPTITIKTTVQTTVEVPDQSYLLVGHLNPKTDEPEIVGMLHFKGQRPEMYAKMRNTMLNKKAGYKFDDVFMLPYESSYVCYAEETIVYLLPGFEEDDDLGLKELTVPAYATFYELSECEVHESKEVRSCPIRLS